MPADALTQLQASVTKATTFNGAALILGGGTPTTGLWCRILYSAATSTTTNTATFSVDVCYDGVPTTWRSDFVADPPLSLTTTAQAGELYIPFEIFPTFVSGAYTPPQIRLTITVAGAGTASVTYQGDIVLARP